MRSEAPFLYTRRNRPSAIANRSRISAIHSPPQYGVGWKFPETSAPNWRGPRLPSPRNGACYCWFAALPGTIPLLRRALSSNPLDCVNKTNRNGERPSRVSIAFSAGDSLLLFRASRISPRELPLIHTLDIQLLQFVSKACGENPRGVAHRSRKTLPFLHVEVQETTPRAAAI